MGWANESIQPDQRDAVDAVAARLTAVPHQWRSCRAHSPGARETAARPRCRALCGSGDRCRSRRAAPGSLAGARRARSGSPMAARVVGVACGARDARTERARNAHSALCPRSRRVRRSYAFIRCRDRGCVHPRRSGAGGGGMDAARRPGHLPAHRCGQLLNHYDSQIRLWPEAGWPQRHQPLAGQRTMSLEAAALTGPVTQLRVHSARATAAGTVSSA
jgi:hypothetical protein